jgi:drug/metabolite transporter (DMT)-like permease
MLGITFTIVATVFFGFATIAMRRGVVSTSALNSLYLTLLPGVPAFWLAAVVSGQIFDAGQLSVRAYGLLAASGGLHFLVGRYTTLRAMEAIGVTRSSPIIVGSVLASVLMAVFFLGEEITSLMWLGIALVIIGPGLAVSQPSRETSAGTTRPTAHFDQLPRARMVKGYAWAVVNAAAFGSSPILVGKAIGGQGLGILGGAVAYSAAGVALLMLLALPGERQSLRRVDPAARRLLLYGAAAIVLAQMFRYLGLSLAPVSIVVPLLRGGIVITLVLSFFYNRELESFNRRVLAGIAIAVVGSIALVI